MPMARKNSRSNIGPAGSGSGETERTEDPYRLQELIRVAPNVPVWICEGEKDAERVAALGFVATTNSEGATKGRAHVIEVADNLRGIVQEIRIIEIRDLPEHGDVSDWLKDHTKEELLARAKTGRVPEYRFKLIPFAEIAINTAPAYLVKDMIPRIGITVVWGPPKCGKSFLIYDLMMHVALGSQGPAWRRGLLRPRGRQRIQEQRRGFPAQEAERPCPAAIPPNGHAFGARYRPHWPDRLRGAEADPVALKWSNSGPTTRATRSALASSCRRRALARLPTRFWTAKLIMSLSN
jgi:AAA domain